MSSLLKLEHLVKNYSSQKAVDDVSFEIQPGSIFGLLGPNGAGKTTVLDLTVDLNLVRIHPTPNFVNPLNVDQIFKL